MFKPWQSASLWPFLGRHIQVRDTHGITWGWGRCSKIWAKMTNRNSRTFAAAQTFCSHDFELGQRIRSRSRGKWQTLRKRSLQKRPRRSFLRIPERAIETLSLPISSHFVRTWIWVKKNRTRHPKKTAHVSLTGLDLIAFSRLCFAMLVQVFHGFTPGFTTWFHLLVVLSVGIMCWLHNPVRWGVLNFMPVSLLPHPPISSPPVWDARHLRLLLQAVSVSCAIQTAWFRCRRFHSSQSKTT